MAAITREDYRSFTDAVVHRIRQRFFHTDFDTVQRGAGAAESEHARSPRRIVAHQRSGHRHGFDFGERDFVAIFVPSQIRIVQAGQHRGDER